MSQLRSFEKKKPKLRSWNCAVQIRHPYTNEKRGKGEKSKSEEKTLKMASSFYCRLRNTL